MKRSIATLAFVLQLALGFAQTTADFENLGLAPGTYLNNSQPQTGFVSGHVFLPNQYTADFDVWSGWAISSMTDATTPGYLNQYSAIAAAGAQGSSTYAVGYAYDGNTLALTGNAAGGVVEGLYLNNSTYAFLSMRDGDAFSKKFGGETGNDPDFFLLTVRKFLDGQIGTDSVSLYLADYRSPNNAMDYIVDEWTYLDLTPLGNADSLRFTLSSSDIGTFGMNTPAYFCMDEVRTTDLPSADRPTAAPLGAWSLQPNPASRFLWVESEDVAWESYRFVDQQGKQVGAGLCRPGSFEIDISPLPAGVYSLCLQGPTGLSCRLFVKQP